MGSPTTVRTPKELAQERISGVFQTSPGLLLRRLVGPFGEGIAQYIALRVGDAARGRNAHRAMLRVLGALAPEELLEAPGPKARLYRLARSIAQTERAMPGPARAGALPWRATKGSRGAAIDRLRAELDEAEAELIELRHARELSLAEMACVLEEREDDVDLALDTAEARARQILGEHAPDPAAERANIFVLAFALEAGWNDEHDEVPSLEDAPLEVGTVIGGRYRIAQRVGVGAFGDVYRAEDEEVPGHRVALKLLRQPSLSERTRQAALRELRMNAAASHPSLVQFKDHGWYEQRLWFVMPWYEGETLEQRMRAGPLSRPEARRIFEPLARALGALHAAGIRHQDIKPDNVLLTRLRGAREDEILPVLIDLGVAADEQEGLIGGTPLYFAPEVAARFLGGGLPAAARAPGSHTPGSLGPARASANDEREGPDVGTPADVFALALSLRNALEPSTQADVPAGAIGAFVAGRALDAPSLPAARALRYLRPFLARCLSLDPAERPSADELAEELAILTAPEERRARRLRVARWLLPMLLALGAVFGAVVHHLDQRAVRRELEARRAESAAAEARADIVVANARRRAIEQGHEALLDRYEQSRLSRRELAGQLATSEGQLSIVRDELTATIAARDASREQLLSTRRALSERDGELGVTRQERDGARHDLETLTRELDTSRAEARRREAELADLRARTREIAGELADERAARETADSRVATLSTSLAEAQRAQRSAESELARVREQVARLATVVRLSDSPAPERAESSAEVAPRELASE